jgi:FAD/FMN-containing dehydrogenase
VRDASQFVHGVDDLGGFVGADSAVKSSDLPSRTAVALLAARTVGEAGWTCSMNLSPMVGHVGDGNFHMLLLVDPNSPEDHAEAERLNERLVQRALAMGGTITGEHGVGLGKQKYMNAQHGSGALALMRAIKGALDPDNLMNPGKILPPA